MLRSHGALLAASDRGFLVSLELDTKNRSKFLKKVIVLSSAFKHLFLSMFLGKKTPSPFGLLRFLDSRFRWAKSEFFTKKPVFHENSYFVLFKKGFVEEILRKKHQKNTKFKFCPSECTVQDTATMEGRRLLLLVCYGSWTVDSGGSSLGLLRCLDSHTILKKKSRT